MKKKKVLFITPGGVGGAERVTVTIAKMLPEDKFEAFFLIVDHSRGHIEDFIPSKYNVEFIRIRNIWDGTCFKIAEVMRRERVDFAFCSLGHLNPHVLLAAKLAGGVKTIIRNDNYVSTIGWYYKIIRIITYPWAHMIISQQEEMRQDYINTLKLKPHKIKVIHNPIDVLTIDKKIAGSRNPFPTNDCINYLWVGRFAPEKGQDILSKAFTIVAQKENDANLYFVGCYEENEYFVQIKQTILAAGLENRVHFVGYDSNPYRWMKYCDCFVLPSRREGLPNTLVEAMFLKRPVVASNCLPIIQRMIVDGENGYIVPVDNPNAMAEAMLKAHKLTRVKMKYKPGRVEEFIDVFR